MNAKRIIVIALNLLALFGAAIGIWWTWKFESLVGSDVDKAVQKMTTQGGLLLHPKLNDIYYNCNKLFKVYIIPDIFPSLIILDVSKCKIERVSMGWRK